MGGPGAGHKSERARRARLANMAKARAARKRAPLPWRSGLESRIIEQLVWQWWMDKNSGPSTPLPSRTLGAGRINEWTAFAKATARQARSTVAEATARQASGEKNKQQIPRRYAPRNDNLHGWQTGADKNRRVSQNEALRYQGDQQRQRNRRASGDKALRYEGNRAALAEAAGKPWAKYRVARLLGVSHTWVNKLVRRFEADPERMRRKMRAFAPASFEKLERAREETRRQRERGWLRGPIRWRRVKVTLEGKKRKVVAVTQAERGRRQAEVEDERARLRQAYGASSGQADALHVLYRDLPPWASGLLLPGDAGVMKGHGPATAGRPRPVPFAFRRRR